MEQLNLFATTEETKEFSKLKIKKKRVRFKTPTFIKSYEIYKDDNGIAQDQQHIYRYKTMYKVYGAIINYINLNPFEWVKESEHKTIGLLRVYRTLETGFCAEIIGTGKLPLKERLLIHLRLLKLLKQNIELQKACKKSIKYWYKLNIK